MGDVILRNYDAVSLFQNNFILRRSRVASFAEIIKIVMIFIKTNLKDSKKLKKT